MDQRKGWRAAERLLKQGKTQSALKQLSIISDAATGDVVTLNRLADLLAQQGKATEAIAYYEKIAERFATGGFVPKAVAIHKKILRLDPRRLASAVQLGQLYGHQKLYGEARKYLLHAANAYVEAREFTKAREVFERLAEAEPGELRHRVRLAESRAAEGDTARAVAELVAVADAFLSRDSLEDARALFEHARELDPRSTGALIGAARCCEAEGRAGAAVELLERHASGGDAQAAALGELARLYEAGGRLEQAFEILDRAALEQVRLDTWERMFRGALERGVVERLWEHLDPLFRARAANGSATELLDVLSRLACLESGGHVPALLCQARLYEDRREVRNAVRALDALAAAYRARSMHDDAARVLERMRRVAPPGEEPAPTRARKLVVTPTAHEAEPAAEVAAEAEDAAAPSAAAEARAVPLTPADEEFVAGRITQAEVLEKYDLLSQALEQIEEVTERFPGYVVGQERRLELLRAMEQGQGRISEALTAFAVALHGAGRMTGAKAAAQEAASLAGLRSVSRRRLEKLGLIQPPTSQVAAPAAEVAAAPPVRRAPAAAAKPAAVPPSAPTPASSRVAAAPASAAGSGRETEKKAAAAPSSAGGEVLIDLDDDEDVGTKATEGAPGPATRPPAPEMIADIRQDLSLGRVLEARRALDALIVLGYSGTEIDELRRDVDAAQVASRAAEGATSPPPGEGPRAEEDEDLAAIRAALEDELAGGSDEPVIPEESSEQGVAEIVAAFRERVDAEVSTSDHRTHYELGIGFKEMGLIDEAIDEFRRAVDAPDLQGVASAMIALCHREREEMDEAVRWYRQALAASGDDEASCNLRYDLAEALLESGDMAEALDEFRGILRRDPAFRDVSGRVSELEERLRF